MAPLEGTVSERLALVDAVDHLLNRGVVLVGETTLSLADVDLVYVGLNVLISSVERLRGQEGGGRQTADRRPPTAGDGVASGERGAGSGEEPVILRSAQDDTPAVGASEPTELPVALPERLSDPSENGLARLVLTLVELLRQLLERQAVRRMEGGSLADAQVERIGVALMELEAKMSELRALFGLEEEDLNLDLGPLGRLLE